MDWIVDSRDAYARWIEVRSPALAAELAMIIWLAERALHGPPAVVDYSSRGFAIARGPNGEEVEFAQVPRPLEAGDRPPWGIIAILSIS